MVSAMVVELHPVGYQLGDFSYGLIAPKPQFLVFDASPEALDKHVVHPAAFIRTPDSLVEELSQRIQASWITTQGSVMP
jgi:hypothetical protein